MSERKSYLLRLPAELLDELNRWAKDELRSVNAQMEFILREAVRHRRRDLSDENSQHTVALPLESESMQMKKPSDGEGA